MKKKRFLFMFAALLAIVQGAWAQSNTTQVLDWDNWCSITLKLTDSYGDGWNTNAIKIVDVLTDTEFGTYTNTNENNQSQAGIAQIYQAEVPDDRDIRFEWVSGSFTQECSYEVYDVNGRLIFSGSGAMSKPVTYHVECTIIPFNLQTADVTATTATLTWDGAQDSYNVRYRTNPTIIEDFEDAVEFAANWTVISNDKANDDGLGINTEKRNGSCGFRFSSYKNASDYNQYLISPDVSGAKSVEFWYKPTTHSAEIFKVGYSTTGNNVADFNNNWGNEISIQSSSDWTKYELNLPDGVKYVAINYYSHYKYYLYIDDITINCGSAGEWVNKTNVTSPLDIDGLEQETKYEWQVQGISPNTDWSDMANFTTTDVFNLTVNAGATGQYWATFYSDASNYQASEGTQVFKVKLTGSAITMTEISDGIVKSGQGVVLKNTSGSSITMTPTSLNSSDNYSDNSLTGTMTSITTTGANNYYVLGKGDEGVGFYKLSENGIIGANKAYLTYDGVLGAREFFLFNDATGIKAIDNEQLTIDNEVYDLQGRRVSQPAKGLYIVRSAEGRLQGKNGKKYIKK